MLVLVLELSTYTVSVAFAEQRKLVLVQLLKEILKSNNYRLKRTGYQVLFNLTSTLCVIVSMSAFVVLVLTE